VRFVNTGGGEEGGEVGCSGNAHTGKQVLVGRHGEARVGAAEPFGDDFDRFAGS
jgi:hypothetical protein